MNERRLQQISYLADAALTGPCGERDFHEQAHALVEELVSALEDMEIEEVDSLTEDLENESRRAAKLLDDAEILAKALIKSVGKTESAQKKHGAALRVARRYYDE